MFIFVTKGRPDGTKSGLFYKTDKKLNIAINAPYQSLLPSTELLPIKHMLERTQKLWFNKYRPESSSFFRHVLNIRIMSNNILVYKSFLFWYLTIFLYLTAIILPLCRNASYCCCLSNSFSKCLLIWFIYQIWIP